MNKFFTLIILSINPFLISCGGTSYDNDLIVEESPESKTLNEVNRKDAFDYLNAVRSKPSAYNEELAVDLSAVEKRDKLL